MSPFVERQNLRPITSGIRRGDSTEAPSRNDRDHVCHKDLMEGTLRKMHGFRTWSPGTINRLVATSRLRWHQRGDLLSTQSEDRKVFVIVTGHAMQVEESKPGEKLALVLCGPNHLLGFCQILHHKNIAREYVANTDVIAIHIPGHLLFEFLDSNPQCWKEMAQMLLKQESERMQMASGQLVGTVAQRLAWIIEKLASLRSIRTNEDCTTCLQVTQQDLAILLRVERRSVHRMLSSWAAVNIIKMEYGSIVILDASALRKISFLAPPNCRRVAI